MKQTQFNFKNGVLKLVAVAVLVVMLVAGLAVSASAATPITVDVTSLVFSDPSITVENNTVTKTYDAATDTAIPGTVTVQNNAGLDPAKVVVTVTSAAWGTNDAGNTQVTVNFSLNGPEADQYSISSAVYAGKILPKALEWDAGTAVALSDRRDVLHR